VDPIPEAQLGGPLLHRTNRQSTVSIESSYAVCLPEFEIRRRYGELVCDEHFDVVRFAMPGHTLIGFGLGNYHNWPLIDIRLFERDLAARQFHFESIQKCFKSLFALLLEAETEHFF